MFSTLNHQLICLKQGFHNLEERFSPSACVPASNKDLYSPTSRSEPGLAILSMDLYFSWVGAVVRSLGLHPWLWSAIAKCGWFTWQDIFVLYVQCRWEIETHFLLDPR